MAGPIKHILALSLFLVSCDSDRAVAPSSLPAEAPEPPTGPASGPEEPAARPTRLTRPVVRIEGGSYENKFRGYSNPPIHPSVGVSSSTLTIDDLEVDLNEVTVAEYQSCVEAGDCTPTKKSSKRCNGSTKPNHPINCVSLDQAKAYCAFENKRLLTDVEWATLDILDSSETREDSILNACVTADSTSFCRGHSDIPPGTCPVGTHAKDRDKPLPNDLVGNVAEWTEGRFCSHKATWCSANVVSGLPWCATIHDPTTRRWLGPDANGPEEMTAHADWIGIRCARDVSEPVSE